MKRSLRVFLFSTLVLLLSACGDPKEQQIDMPASGDAVEPVTAKGGSVLGTIEATLDGESRTWYVLEAVLDGEREYGALWYVLEDQEEATAVFTGYDAPDVPFETFDVDRETLTMDYGDYDGSLFTLTFSFVPGSNERRTFSMPDANGAAVVYVPDVSAGITIDTIHGLEEGTISVTDVQASRTGTSQFAGTFNGTLLKPEQGAPISVTDGHFKISEAHYEDNPGQ